MAVTGDTRPPRWDDRGGNSDSHRITYASAAASDKQNTPRSQSRFLSKNIASGKRVWLHAHV